MRVSFGLNGAIVRMADVPALRSYYEEHVARRPPDHMTVEWFAGERPQSAATKRGRAHVAFRYNVLEHFGRSSSLRDKEAPHYARCYATLNTNVVFEVEAFNEPACPDEETLIWPCTSPPEASLRAGALPPTKIPFEQLAERGQAATVQTWVPKHM